MTKFIISVHPTSEKEALFELKEHFNGLQIKKLSTGVFLCKLEGDIDLISKKVHQKRICFIRHIVPVNREFDLLNTTDDYMVFSKNIHLILPLIKTADIILHVSFLTPYPMYNKKDFVEPIIKSLQKNRISIDNSSKQILSVVLFQNKMYVGYSTVTQSLTSWPLGHLHYAFKTEQPSRAEFKIAESVELFNLDLSKYKTAIDLGAAPGGWSRFLLEKGMSVVAVDPAELNPGLFKYEKLKHFKCLSQDFFKKHPNSNFDMIVNDMRMDVQGSVEVMLNAFDHLKRNGIAIMTLKLNPRKKLEEIEYGIKNLSKKYTILHTRQLYHNRSEVTVVLSKK